MVFTGAKRDRGMTKALAPAKPETGYQRPGTSFPSNKSRLMHGYMVHILHSIYSYPSSTSHYFTLLHLFLLTCFRGAPDPARGTLEALDGGTHGGLQLQDRRGFLVSGIHCLGIPHCIIAHVSRNETQEVQGALNKQMMEPEMDINNK